VQQWNEWVIAAANLSHVQPIEPSVIAQDSAHLESFGVISACVWTGGTLTTPLRQGMQADLPMTASFFDRHGGVSVGSDPHWVVYCALDCAPAWALQCPVLPGGERAACRVVLCTSSLLVLSGGVCVGLQSSLSSPRACSLQSWPS
jgi:hypothetical protein